MIKLLHKIFHHKAWLLPIPIALIGIPTVLLIHFFGASWASLLIVGRDAMWIVGGVFFIVLGIVMLNWMFPGK
jgi:hypothetical protein